MTSPQDTLKQMSHIPHPFHIVGECESCCNESEATRTGYYETSSGWGFGAYVCDTEGCVNYGR